MEHGSTTGSRTIFATVWCTLSATVRKLSGGREQCRRCPSCVSPPRNLLKNARSTSIGAR